ncbi:hypothetical protein FQZ97_1078120 [compost metagenome]
MSRDAEHSVNVQRVILFAGAVDKLQIEGLRSGYPELGKRSLDDSCEMIGRAALRCQRRCSCIVVKPDSKSLGVWLSS